MLVFWGLGVCAVKAFGFLESPTPRNYGVETLIYIPSEAVCKQTESCLSQGRHLGNRLIKR